MRGLVSLARQALALALVTALVAAPGLAAAPAAPGRPAPAAPQPRLDPARLQAVVDRVVREGMRRDGVAGVDVAVVGLDGPLLLKGYGIAAPGRPVDARTLFEVQSISKTFTWLALMQLVDAGKLRLGDPINAYLPAELKVPDEGYARPITIGDLMSHTPGFEDSEFGHLFVDDPERLQPLRLYLARHRPHRVRPPGELVVYDNYGAALGGVIVEQVSGLAWEDYAAQRILAPLGMADASFRQPYPAALAAARRLPAPMSDDLAARLSDDFRRGAHGPEVAPRELTSDVPAGALTASPVAMAAYMQALLDPARMERLGVLKAATALQMREPQVRGPAGFGDMRHGYEAIALPGGYEAFGHGGGSTYSGASLTLIPSLGLGIFVAANTGGSHRLVWSVPSAIVAAFYSPALPPPVYGPEAAAQARAVAGDYLDLRRSYDRTESGVFDLFDGAYHISAQPNGDLLMSSLLGEDRPLTPLGGGVYRDRDGPVRVAFRPLNGRMALYTPYADTVLEPVGYFRTLGWVALIVVLTMAGALAVLGGGIRRLLARRQEAPLARWASASLDIAALAWLAGFGLFGATLFKALTATDVDEIMWWYPSPTLIGACWTFAAAAALSVAALPGLSLVARPGGWSLWRRAGFAVTLAIFLACAATLWTLHFLGFSGW